MKDSEEAVRHLIELVQQTHKLGCVFKLLLTSPKNSHRLYKLVPGQARDVLWITSRVPPTGGFTSMKWRASINARMG